MRTLTCFAKSAIILYKLSNWPLKRQRELTRPTLIGEIKIIAYSYIAAYIYRPSGHSLIISYTRFVNPEISFIRMLLYCCMHPSTTDSTTIFTVTVFSITEIIAKLKKKELEKKQTEEVDQD